MSWGFRKAGADKHTLKVAVLAEHAPQEVKDRICQQIDGVVLAKSQAILVESSGHFQSPTAQPTYGDSTEKTSVHVIPLIDTPLAP